MTKSTIHFAATTTGRRSLSNRAIEQRELFTRYVSLVRQLARSRGVQVGDVDDVVQRVFLVAFTKFERIEPSAARAFICGVALREILHVRRSYLRRAEVPAEQLSPLPEPSVDLDTSVHASLVLRRTLFALRDQEPQLAHVWVLHEVQGFSCQSIAQRQGLAVGTVKSRLRRARIALRQLTDPDAMTAT